MTGSPVSASQTRPVPSQPAVATRRPSGLNVANRTPPACRSGGVIGSSGACVPDPGAAVAAGGHDARALRVELGVVDEVAMINQWGRPGSVEARSQTRTLPSAQAVTMRWPSELNDAEVTMPSCGHNWMIRGVRSSTEPSR